ncbi:hypothetical protein [Thioalkalivibrio sp. ALE16]|uniref:hypothetical protein n=1 Tax=Thioalkalivibrio sp. ALE16 TaxID=1158172 RepID=UPI00036B43C3|nr:hypothetical protein [Thioalkalivibrio sp. ALE16]
MINLILVVMALLLGAIALTAAIKYIPVDSEIRASTVDAVVAQIDVLEKGVNGYLNEVRNPATGSVDLGPTRDTLMDDLSPEYVFAPRAPGNGEWTAGVGAYLGRDAIWVCLNPPKSGWAGSVQAGINDAVQRALPDKATIQADTCGADTNVAEGAYLTYWFAAHQVSYPGTAVEFVDAPNPSESTLYDENRVVRIRLNVDAEIEMNSNQDPAGGVTARIELREPGGSWVTADRWQMEVEQALPALAVTGTTASGEDITGGTETPQGGVRLRRNAALEAVIPAGWEMRTITEVPGNHANVTIGPGQLQRFW